MNLPYLPTINSSEQAFALARKHRDIFYLAAFRLQLWIGDLLTEAMNQYTRYPNPADRSMQTGQAWRAFQSLFDRIQDQDFHDLLYFLLRLSECDNPVSTPLLAAWVPVYREHELSGNYFSRSPLDPYDEISLDLPLMRRSVQRMCDWLDAIVHVDTHILWVLEPACFDPDPEIRRLATLATTQPCVAQLDDPQLVAPYVHKPAADRPQHPSPSPSPSAAVATPGPHRPFEPLDESIMTIWPLVKFHNWSYADLWNVLAQSAVRFNLAPCSNHRDLARYCSRTLGLRKSGCGQTTRDSLPPGHPIAHRLLGHFTRRSRRLGRGPWS